MCEPTIPEAAVEAAVTAHRATWRRSKVWNDEGKWEWGESVEEAERRAMRAALTAAEPLMHEGHHAVIDRLYAENARYREALTEPDILAIRHLVNGCSLPLTMEAARERWLRGLDKWHEMLLPTALAPSDEDEDRV